MWKKPYEEYVLTIFKDLLRINTTNGTQNEREAAEYIRNILENVGIDVELFEKRKDRTNLVAKLEGGEREPLYLISHLDVVYAAENQWTYPPFSGEEHDGVIWGRGTLDTKQLVVMQLIAFLQLAEMKDHLNRDVYFISTADEENGSSNGMAFLINKYPELFQKGIVLNEGGGFIVNRNGKPYMLYTAGEKGVAILKLTAKGQGGHASCPPQDQAMKKLAAAIDVLLNAHYPKRETTISKYYKRVLKVEKNEKPENNDEKLILDLLDYMESTGPLINDLQVGTSINGIPNKAEAEVEFRLVPGISQREFREAISNLLDKIDIDWEITSFDKGFVCDIDSQVTKKMAQTIKKHGSQADLVPFIALGRTDGRFLGDTYSNIYGFSPLTEKDSFVQVLRKVHNIDESITKDSFFFGARVITELSRTICCK